MANAIGLFALAIETAILIGVLALHEDNSFPNAFWIYVVIFLAAYLVLAMLAIYFWNSKHRLETTRDSWLFFVGSVALVTVLFVVKMIFHLSAGRFLSRWIFIGGSVAMISLASLARAWWMESRDDYPW